MGYVIASEDVINGVKKVHDFLTVGAAAPLQEAAVAGLKLPELYYEELLNLYSAKRRLFLNFLTDAGLTYYTPEGAYYVLVDITKFHYENDFSFCEWLIKEIGVASSARAQVSSKKISKIIYGSILLRKKILLLKPVKGY